MVTITAAELQKQFGKFRDMARREPVSVTHHGRDDLVVMSKEEYNRLKSMEDEMDKARHEAMKEIFDAHKETFTALAQR